MVITFITISCKRENVSSNKMIEYNLSNIEGHTFLRVDKTTEGLVLFQPCDANIPMFKFYKDSIYHNWGQEYYSYSTELLKKNKNGATYKTRYKYNSEIPETSDSIIEIQLLDNNKKTWKINDELYIDSNYKNSIPYRKENCSDNYETSQKKNNHISEKWFGRYQLNLNEEKNWQEQKSISLDIKKDSIIYEANGYQLHSVYLLTGQQIDDNKISLEYSKIIDGLESEILKKTKDFGILVFDGKNYNWQCPYLNESYSNGKKNTYNLEKNKDVEKVEVQ